MELALYHLQHLIYYALLGLLIIRFILNAVIYHKIDSDIIQSDIPDYWTMISFSENEKEEKRRKYGHIKDFSRDGSQDVMMEWIHYALTFWWPYLYNEEVGILRLKRIANVLNVLFMVFAPLCLVLFLYLQGANFKYRNVTEDWFFFLN